MTRFYWLSCLGLVCVLAGTACAPELVPAAATAPKPSSSPNKGETPEESESRELGRTWGWILVGGVGGTAGVIAIGTSVVMLVDHSTRDRDCNAAKVCSSSGLDANSQLAGLAGLNTGSWVVAAAGLGIGAYLLLTNPARATGTQVGVEPSGAGASLRLRTAF